MRAIAMVVLACLVLDGSRVQAQPLVVEPTMRELTIRHYAAHGDYLPVLVSAGPPPVWTSWPNNAAGEVAPGMVPDGFYGTLTDSSGNLTAYGVAVMTAVQQAYEGLKLDAVSVFVNSSWSGGASDPTALGSGDFTSFATPTTSDTAGAIAARVATMKTHARSAGVTSHDIMGWTGVGATGIEFAGDSGAIGGCCDDVSSCVVEAYGIAISNATITSGAHSTEDAPSGIATASTYWGGSCDPDLGHSHVRIQVYQGVFPRVPQGMGGGTFGSTSELYLKVTNVGGTFRAGSLGANPPVAGTASPGTPSWELAYRLRPGQSPPPVGVFAGPYMIANPATDPDQGWVVVGAKNVVRWNFRGSQQYPNLQPAGGVPPIRPNTPPGLAGEGDLDGEVGQYPMGCAPVNFTTGVKSESVVDLIVAATGKPFTLEREYTSDYSYTSESAGNLIGRGWMATPFRSISVSGSGTSRVVTLFGPPMQRTLVFTNPNPSTAPNVWKTGGPSSQTLVRTNLIVDDVTWPTWRLIEPGGWTIDFYRTPDTGEGGVQTPPVAVIGMILQERDPYWTNTFGLPTNPRTYVYQLPDPSDTQSLRARLRAIYINGTPKGYDTEAEVVFTWHFQSGPLNGKLDKIEVKRRIGDTNEYTTTQAVDYTYAAEGSGWSGAIGSDADLVQVISKELVDEVPADSPAPEPYRTRITQYRYHNGAAVASSGTDERLLIEGAAGQLKAIINAEQIEWYAQQRAPQESGWSAADALASSAVELLGKADSAALGSPVGSMTVVDLAAKIIGYENSTGGRVSAQFLQSSCGCSSGSSQGIKQVYVYSGTYEAQSGNDGCSTRVEEYLGQASGAGVYESSPYRMTYYDMEFLGPTGSPVPYLVNKAVREPGVRTWVWHSEYDSNRNLSRTITPSGTGSYESFDESASGAPEYIAGVAGLSFRYVYVNNRLSETRRGGPTATGTLITKITYDTTGAVPDHLPIKIERYRTSTSSPGEDEIETTTFTYGIHDEAGASRDARAYPLMWVKTSVESELQGENGPDSPATYDTYELYDIRGRNFWSRAADGSLTHRTFDAMTGTVTQETQNADPVAPAGDAGVPLPANHFGLVTDGWGRTGSAVGSPRLAGGELVTTSTVDRLGRLVRTVASPGASPTRPSGVVGASTYMVRGLRKLPGQAFGPYLYTETVLPHKMAGEGVEYAGPAAITWYNAAGKVLAEVDQALDVSVSTYDPMAAPPAYTLASTLRSRRAVIYFPSGLMQSERVWHAINQSDLSDTAYSYVKSYEYDAAGRVSQVNDFDGTVTKSDYDVLDRVIRTYVGVSTATLQQTAEFYYDAQSPYHTGVGNGLLGLERRFVGPSSGEPLSPDYYRDTKRFYNASGLLVKVVPPTPPYQYFKYDTQDRVIEAAESDGSLGEPATMSNLGADRGSFVKTFYSQRGLVYKKQVAVDPASSSPSFLSTYTWFDPVGRAIAEWGPNAPATKRTFDALGRVTALYTTDRGGDAAPGASGNYADATALTGDAVVTQSVPKYGTSGTREEGRLLLDRSYQRLHDSTATGELTYTNAIVTYTGHLYDDAGRPIRTVDFGTHRSDTALVTGSASDEPAWPPASTPGHTWTDPNCSSCQPPAVTAVAYDARGLIGSETDALGRATRYVYDDLGRRGVTIENSVSITASSMSWDRTGGDWSISGLSNSAATDQDRVSTMLYDGAGRTTQQAIYNVTGTGSPSQPYKQTTKYIYGISNGTASTTTDSLVASNGLLAEVQYPGETDGSVQPSDNAFKVRYSYNRQGERRSVTDQNGTLHVFRLDAAGRTISDTVESINTSLLDNTVKRIGYSYDGMGRRSKITSYNQLTPSQTVLNEVQFTYTSMGQVARVYQNPDGAVSFDSSGEPLSGGTRVVRYGYTGTSTAASNNYSRLEALTYPDGTVVNQIYNPTGSSSSVDAAISRPVRTEIDGSTPIPLVEYRYLGLDTPVIAELAAAAIRLDRTVSASGAATSGQYPGLDHRGRVYRQLWVDQGFATGSGGFPNRPPIFSEALEYDRFNRIRRQELRPGPVWPDRDAGWEFDGLNRVSLEHRGVFDTSTGWAYSTSSPQPSREFDRDALGNWLATALDTDANGAFATGERETRTHNQANELIGRSIPGASTITVADGFDDVGSLRTSATTIGPVTTTTTYTHDAWNRLVSWSVNSTSGSTSQYYGLHWRAKVTQPGGAVSRTFYDASWRMLEVRRGNLLAKVDQWFWGGRHIDDIVAHRIDTGRGGDHSDDTLYLHATDAQFNTRAVLKPSGSSAPAILVERLEYDAFGTARHHWPGDTDGDGDYDATDEAAISGLASVSIGGSGYNVEADLDRSGTIDAADTTLAGGSTYKSALSVGQLSGAGGNVVGFGGYVFDADLGLYLVRNRWYDPARGRWFQRDPAGCVDGCNLYQYCGGDPWNSLDPMGLWLEGWATALATSDTRVGRWTGYGLGVAGTAAESVWDSGVAIFNPMTYVNGVRQGIALEDANGRRGRYQPTTLGYATSVIGQFTGANDLAAGIYGVDALEGRLLQGWERFERGGTGGAGMIGTGAGLAAGGIFATRSFCHAPVAAVPAGAIEPVFGSRIVGPGISEPMGPVGITITGPPIHELLPAARLFRGGAYGKLETVTGWARHHIPADSVSPVTTHRGPAIQMEIPDHMRTSSYGNSAAARAYRGGLQTLIEAGQMRDAVAREIRDVRRIAGRKYNDALREMLEYARKQMYIR